MSNVEISGPYESPAANMPPPLPPSGASPLGEGEFALIRNATVRRRKINSAARVAKSSFTVTLTIGVLGVGVALLWWSWWSLLIALAICAVGIVEYMGQRRMRQSNPSAARILGANQLAFLAVIIFYCLIQMFTFSTDQAKNAVLSPEFRAQMSGMPNSMQKSIDKKIDLWGPILNYGFYSLVIVLSVVCQGGLALYYFTRKRYIQSFNRDTPQWIRRLFIEASL